MGKGFKVYWRAYGGFLELFYSPYFVFSWFSAILLHPLWYLKQNEANAKAVDPEWIGIAFSVLPSIVGFSLGSIAILVSVSNGRMLKEIQLGGDESLLMKIAAAFFHFLMLQLLCLVFAIIVKAYPVGFLSYIGMFLLLYALCSGVATASILIFVARLRNWIDESDKPD